MSEPADTKPTRRRAWIGTVILLLLIAAAAAIIAVNPLERFAQILPEQTDLIDDQKIEKVTAVKTTVTSLGDLQNYFKVNGDVVINSTVDAYSDVAGKLVSIAVNVGDTIRKGDLLAQVDPSRTGMIYEKSMVYAPSGGTVLSVNYSTGATISPQLPLIRIGDLDQKEIAVSVAERYVGQVSIGQHVDISLESYPGMDFSGYISETSPVLNAATRTLGVSIVLDQPSQRVKVGMFPSVIVYTESREQVHIIPRAGVLYEGDQPYVYTVENGDRAARKDITLGLTVDDYAEVLTGLDPGSEIITLGQTLITDGALIRIDD
ncbi:MAG: efflux RND transporter periplasmic adaptor subunit [Spirochaetia bacterium]|nr:efflux RND transporter periplasmic adaptor subunit [Spirochaetia bacterium]